MPRSKHPSKRAIFAARSAPWIWNVNRIRENKSKQIIGEVTRKSAQSKTSDDDALSRNRRWSESFPSSRNRMKRMERYANMRETFRPRHPSSRHWPRYVWFQINLCGQIGAACMDAAQPHGIPLMLVQKLSKNGCRICKTAITTSSSGAKHLTTNWHTTSVALFSIVTIERPTMDTIVDICVQQYSEGLLAHHVISTKSQQPLAMSAVFEIKLRRPTPADTMTTRLE